MDTIKFIISIEKTFSKYSQANDEIIKKNAFNSEKDAKNFIKKMVKEYKLNKYHGFWGNTQNGIELTTNF